MTPRRLFLLIFLIWLGAVVFLWTWLDCSTATPC
jgi:hypothetical protein